MNKFPANPYRGNTDLELSDIIASSATSSFEHLGASAELHRRAIAAAGRSTTAQIITAVATVVTAIAAVAGAWAILARR
jgi:hypothetical protein